MSEKDLALLHTKFGRWFVGLVFLLMGSCLLTLGAHFASMSEQLNSKAWLMMFLGAGCIVAVVLVLRAVVSDPLIVRRPPDGSTEQ